MRNPVLILMAVFLMLVNACGRVEYIGKQGANGMMSETEAMETLYAVPMDDVRGARGGRVVSAVGLEQLIQDLIASGRVQLPASARGAVGANGMPDLSALNQIFSLLQSGQGSSLFGLANGLINLNGGAAGAGGKLQNLMSILNTVAPLIASIAPQYAPIIQALTTILPLVVTFIGMFKKPKRTASLGWFQPVAA